MFEYSQKTGELWRNRAVVANCYSGHQLGKNNPALQHVKDVGPIPCGLYTIEAPVDTVTHGPYVLRLTPDAKNEMFGRAGFLIHGDSVVHPGSASEGCIVTGRSKREQIWESGDRRLMVFAEFPVKPKFPPQEIS